MLTINEVNCRSASSNISQAVSSRILRWWRQPCTTDRRLDPIREHREAVATRLLADQEKTCRP